MKSLTISFPLTVALFTVATLRLDAAIDPMPAGGDWEEAVKKAQSQFAQHHLAEAEESSKRALRIAKRFGDSDSRVAMTYYQLGNIHRDWGHCGEARTSYSRSIAAWEKQSNPPPAYVFNSIMGLLGTLCECDQYDAAEKTLRAYESRLRYYQSRPLDEAQVLSIRAVIFRARKNYGQAETSYRRAIELLEHSPDGTPLRIQEERGNLASVIDRQGRHAEALAESERVIAYFERSGPSRTINFAASLNNAACSLADLGRKEEAARAFERALAAARELVGEDSRFTAKIMLNYARVLRETKETAASEAMQKQGAEALRRALVRDTATVDIQDLK